MKKRIGALAFAVVALTAGVAMAVETGGRPWTVVATGLGWNDSGVVTKVCDSGRAVYVFDNAYFEYGGISVVPNAPECQFGR